MFHAHQAAEKALKAALVEESTPFRKTHDLIVLVGLVAQSLAAELVTVDVLLLQPWATQSKGEVDALCLSFHMRRMTRLVRCRLCT